MVKHTPGPWIRVNRKVYKSVNGYAARFIADLDTSEYSGGTKADRLEDYANAILVESAPALLEALDKIFHHAYDDTTPIKDIFADFDSMREIARKAIAKAGGK
jgi:hypothetical protein